MSQPSRHAADPNLRLPDLIHHWASTDTTRFETKHQVPEASKARPRHQHWDSPCLRTCQRDGVFYPSPKTFTDANKVIDIGSTPNKTRETSFQILNRTVWTNRKAYRSGIADSASCNRCEEEETMEHLLYGCENYSAVV
jgi:hypothetical protein